MTHSTLPLICGSCLCHSRICNMASHSYRDCQCARHVTTRETQGYLKLCLATDTDRLWCDRRVTLCCCNMSECIATNQIQFKLLHNFFYNLPKPYHHSVNGSTGVNTATPDSVWKRPNTVRLVSPRGCNGAQQCYELNENVKCKQAQNEHA